jgi:hypothetical protein
MHQTMEEKHLNLHEWLEKFEAGAFNTWDTHTQIEAGWYDWFCKDSTLANKTQSLGKKLKSIIKSTKLDPKNQYVFFKNNCPCVGSLYDDFRICDMKSGDVVYTIVPRSGHKVMQGKGEVWGKENAFKEALFEGSWGEIKKWFLTK